MIKSKYNPKWKYDNVLPQVVNSIRRMVTEDDDDYLLMFVGTTGTGKSSLMLHTYELYAGKDADTRYISMTRDGFAESLREAKSSDKLRFCCNDEANVSKREALAKWNRDVIDLYYSIRGLNIFHTWCNPSIEMLDKVIIKDLIKGLIFIVNKDRDRPRVYYYYRKEDLLRIMEKYKSLELPLLKRVCKKYAYYRGWFKPYTGRLWKPYLKKKGNRMNQKVDEFFEKYGNGEENKELTISQLSKLLRVTKMSIYRYTKTLVDEGKLVINKNYYENAAGRKYYVKETISIFEDLMKRLADKKERNIRYNET